MRHHVFDDLYLDQSAGWYYSDPVPAKDVRSVGATLVVQEDSGTLSTTELEMQRGNGSNWTTPAYLLTVSGAAPAVGIASGSTDVCAEFLRFRVSLTGTDAKALLNLYVNTVEVR